MAGGQAGGLYCQKVEPRGVKRFTLIAVDPEGERREWPLDKSSYVVGRDPQTDNGIPVPGDRHLSRQHFSLQVAPDKVLVERAPSGRNPLFFNGEQSDQFRLEPGQVFYTGKTQFGILLGEDVATITRYTLAGNAKEEARLRRLEDCFSAVLELLKALREQSQVPAWQVAFPVLRAMLPDAAQVAFLQVHRDSAVSRVVDQDPTDTQVEVDSELVGQALQTKQTVTAVSEDLNLHQRSNETLKFQQKWSVATPVHGLEQATFVLWVSGTGAVQRETLEERATLVDLVAEMVGHHIVIRQGSEYSSLLGVFGHHVGTLFKTSGALQLWSQAEQDSDVKRVLNKLLPIWGISQAISLHKKRGEKAEKALLESWIKEPVVELEELRRSLCSIVSHVYFSPQDEPFLQWRLNGKEISGPQSMQSLPPLADVPQLFDKTLALTIGLLEMLNNVRKYPASTGSGREDRRDLAELTDAERTVLVSVEITDNEAAVEVVQPVVTASGGEIPKSRSLERIRALEQSLLGAIVGTEAEMVVGKTSSDYVVLVRHRWVYRFGQLLQDWKDHFRA